MLYNRAVAVVDKIAELEPRRPRKQRNLNQITTLVIHHDAGAKPPRDDAGTFQRLRSYYQQHSGLFPYHYAIAWDGTIYKCNPLSSILPHAKGANTVGVGIMLLGYFHPPHNEQPTAAQINSLRLLIADLKRGLPIHLQVTPHREVVGSKTACPGDLGMAALKAAGIIP